MKTMGSHQYLISSPILQKALYFSPIPYLKLPSQTVRGLAPIIFIFLISLPVCNQFPTISPSLQGYLPHPSLPQYPHASSMYITSSLCSGSYSSCLPPLLQEYPPPAAQALTSYLYWADPPMGCLPLPTLRLWHLTLGCFHASTSSSSNWASIYPHDATLLHGCLSFPTHLQVDALFILLPCSGLDSPY